MFLCNLLNKQVYKFTHFFVSHMCEFIICYFNQQVPRFKITGARPLQLKCWGVLCLRGSYSPVKSQKLVVGMYNKNRYHWQGTKFFYYRWADHEWTGHKNLLWLINQAASWMRSWPLKTWDGSMYIHRKFILLAA